MKKLMILVLPLMLSACWTGPDFYAAAPSEAPIAAGQYKVVRIVTNYDRVNQDFDRDDRLDQGVGTTVRISYIADGDVQVANPGGDDSPDNTRLIALDADAGLYVVQVDPGQGVASLQTRVYGLVQMVPGGYRLSVPPCDGTRRLKPGSRVVVKGLLFQKSCSFQDRETFEAAMREFASDPSSWTEYRFVKS
jgi:hypothetical protein